MIEPSKASGRFVWAVDTLEVRPADPPARGRLRARRRGLPGLREADDGNDHRDRPFAQDDRDRHAEDRDNVDAGRAVLEAIALEDADLGDRHFDKVFAFNLAPFWQQPEAALGAIREHLARNGTVYLFWDARHAPARARDLGKLADRPREGGFSVDRVLVEDLRPVPAVCAMGRPPGG